VRATLVLLLTTLAFLASLFVVAPPMAHAKKGGAAIDSAARLATVHVAKPDVRKAERTPGAATALRVFSVEPAAFVLASATPPPKLHTPFAPHRSLFMVFLN
jgi:hypothetical protein